MTDRIGRAPPRVVTTTPAAPVVDSKPIATVVEASGPTPKRETVPGKLSRATIVGAGPAGLAQASLLLKRAQQVGLSELTIVELRPQYTRPVGIAFRQMNLDALAWLNPAALDELARRSNLSPDGCGHMLDAVHWDHNANAFVDSEKPVGDKGDASRFQAIVDDKAKSVAEHAEDMMRSPTMSLFTLQDLEESYMRGLEKMARDAGVKLRILREHDIKVERKGDLVSVDVQRVKDRKPVGDVEKLPPQDLVLVAQGGNSSVRRQLGETHEAGSPADRFIAGIFQDPPGARPAQSVYREDDVVDPETGKRSTVRLVRGVHGLNGTHWCLAQIPEHVKLTTSIADIEDVARLRAIVEKRLGRTATDAEIVGQRVAEEVEAYFRDVHSTTGPSDLPISYGPNLFTLQSAKFDDAKLADNCICVGDAVGTSHFNVSGGAATGVTTHTLALDRYLDAITRGVSQKDAIDKLDVELRQATLVWQLFGITQFEGDPIELRDKFFKRDELAQVLPATFLEKYFPKDGGVPSRDKNPTWHAWMTRVDPATKPKEVPADVVDTLVREIEASQARSSRVRSRACLHDMPAPAPVDG